MYGDYSYSGGGSYSYGGSDNYSAMDYAYATPHGQYASYGNTYSMNTATGSDITNPGNLAPYGVYYGQGYAKQPAGGGGGGGGGGGSPQQKQQPTSINYHPTTIIERTGAGQSGGNILSRLLSDFNGSAAAPAAGQSAYGGYSSMNWTPFLILGGIGAAFFLTKKK